MRPDFERLFQPGGGSGFPRMPAIAAEGMVATSHPLATRAGLRALEPFVDGRGDGYAGGP